jgi:UDP-N-acetylglucosamine 2-epimerase (non-hydrolysing)
MTSFESLCLERKPGLVIVGGDVNSTLACALVAAKLLVRWHISSRPQIVRSLDAEKVTRVLTDHISSCFSHGAERQRHLMKEGVQRDSIHLVGNCMIDI